jgi:type 1 glutamine amidotransferase
MRLRASGIVDVAGTPFELLDPERVPEGKNVLVLRGGRAPDWDSWRMPARVEIPVGFAFARLHVLGGIAAWGYPFTQERANAAKLTVVYRDGASEEHVFVDGREFADWIRKSEVPGSEWVDLVAEGSAGQVRRFQVDLARPDAPVEKLVLESFVNGLAPTFVALTAELAPSAEPAAAPSDGPDVPAARPRGLVLGGGSSHDFRRWFGEEDLATLAEPDSFTQLGPLAYVEDPRELAARLGELQLVVLCNNQPLADPELRSALFAFVERGGGLLLLHAATWYNWADWPAYNAELVGGGARGHEEYGELGVRVVDPAHSMAAGLPRSFSITDELYRFEPDPAASSHVVLVGTSRATGAEFPVAWTRIHGGGRIAVITLGHDGAAHTNRGFQTLLRNAVRWLGAE